MGIIFTALMQKGEPMDDLISRQALCEYALNQKDKVVTPNDIMRFSSADRPKGKWVWFGKILDIGDVQELVCDVCEKTILWVDDHYPNDEEPKYCPNCGARMDWKG